MWWPLAVGIIIPHTVGLLTTHARLALLGLVMGSFYLRFPLASSLSCDAAWHARYQHAVLRTRGTPYSTICEGSRPSDPYERLYFFGSLLGGLPWLEALLVVSQHWCGFFLVCFFGMGPLFVLVGSALRFLSFATQVPTSSLRSISKALSIDLPGHTLIGNAIIIWSGASERNEWSPFNTLWQVS